MDEKIKEWNKHIRVRDRLDLMKLKTVAAYDKRKAANIKDRLYRIERKKDINKKLRSIIVNDLIQAITVTNFHDVPCMLYIMLKKIGEL